MSKYEVLNSEGLFDRFQDLLLDIDQTEIQGWLNSAPTQALLVGLAHSEAVIMERWREGGFTADTTDGTAQLSAEAIGMLKAISLVKSYILEEISVDDQREGA